MSGKIEEKMEAFLNKFFGSISWLPELADAGERKLAGGHFTWMASISLLALTIGHLAGGPHIGAYVSLGSFLLIVEAERPPIGRRIDWITRGAGWLLGAICSGLTLILH